MPWSTHRLAAEEEDPASLLHWYRELTALRHDQAGLREGGFELLPESEPGIIGWLRRGAEVAGAPGEADVVLLNLSPQPAAVSLTAVLQRMGVTLPASGLRRVLSTRNPEGSAVAPGNVSLEPYGVYIGAFTTQRGLKSVATPVKRSRSSGL
jgi:hypothetical protein